MFRVKKKYEIWFLFAGRPIRMSLHEFAHVTGLNCKKIPSKYSKKRKKNPIKEKLYWGELFGSLKFCLGDLAIEMLKKRALVFMAAVPQIKEIVPQVEPVILIESDSESDSALSDSHAEEEAEQTDPQTVTPPAVVRYCINPNHVKVMDEEAKVDMTSIIEGTTHSPEDLLWDDEIEDENAFNMEKRNRKRRRPRRRKRPERPPPDSPESDASYVGDHTHIANLVASLVKPNIENAVASERHKLEVNLVKVIQAEIQKMQRVVMQGIIDVLRKPYSVFREDIFVGGQGVGDNPPAAKSTGPDPAQKFNSPSGETMGVLPNKSSVKDQPLPSFNPENVNLGDCITAHKILAVTDETLNQAPKNSTPHMSLATVDEEESYHEDEIDFLFSLIEIPSFSLGLSQDDARRESNIPPQITIQEACDTRKSKRTRTLPPIFNDYQCDPKIKAFRPEDTAAHNEDNIDEVYSSMRERAGHNKSFTVANDMTITTEDLAIIVMDVLMHYISLDRTRKRTLTSTPKIAFYDTNFPASLMQLYARLTKTAVKDRVNGIQQNPDSNDSAVMTVRLIQAHASNGLEGCKEVTVASLPGAAKHLAVLIYRDITPV
ncbi:hypothetical protein F2Q69_00057243 [Brassica cretica]|uniref:DUF1985 domain-containing protein n=1 Tax=Brassica cretica TaxID=69181 RepID=A0A8S9MZ83_BRACR|nr:hypothetical protein F2Q69_00057243 [Brassica cretica]